MVKDAKAPSRSQTPPPARKAGASQPTPKASEAPRPEPRADQPQGGSVPGQADTVAVAGTTSEAGKSKLDLAVAGAGRVVGGVAKAVVPVALSPFGAVAGAAAAVLDAVTPPPPAGGPKSSVLEAQTAEFRAVARRHERGNSLTPFDAALSGKALFSFLSEPRGAGALADGTPGGKPPSKDKNEFAERVRPQVAALGDWVLSQPASAKLTPTDIYEQALKLNRGDAFDARLTAHNMLKEVGATEAGHPQTDAARNNAINERLVNIRDPRTRDEGNYRDKMGPWYHLFAVGVITAATKGVTGSNGMADLLGKVTNDKVKERSDGPGRRGDAQEEAARLWANRVFDQR